jgi:hypothetical protein
VQTHGTVEKDKTKEEIKKVKTTISQIQSALTSKQVDRT